MKKLVKSSTNKMLDGICAGFAEYFEIDPSITRLVFLLIGLVFPISAVLFYFISMIVIPKY